MKSARFAESFAWQMNVPVQDIAQVEYRHKYPDRPANWYNAMLTLRDGEGKKQGLVAPQRWRLGSRFLYELSL
ncbi:MAG: hypothetical protein HC830_09075 [Bacteroidetes bacterium]|nr:hypothetical protein [Bacteroidota bacterium]